MLVEGCGMKLKSYKSRQQHLVDKHQFPKSFEFFKRHMGRPRPWRCARAARRRRRGQCYGSGQRRTPDDPFFAAGDDMERKLLAKHCGMLLVMVALDLSEDDRYQLEKMEVASANTLFCPIAGCGAHLDCLENFDDHCRTRHTASCCVCSRVYPTSRLLSIHISVVHDSFFQAKVARGFPMVIGSYRYGKSFLLNQLLSLSCDKGFGVGPMRDTKTKGIRVWGTPVKIDVDGTKVSILQLDTEGFESVEKSNVYDDRVLALATVLSSVLVYNLPETICEGPILLEDYHLIEKLAQFDRERIPEGLNVLFMRGEPVQRDFLR